MQRSGIALLVVGLLAVAAAYVAALLGMAPVAAPWWLASGTTAVLAALATLGAARHGRRTPVLLATIVTTFACVAVGFLVPLALPLPQPGEALLLGLPRPTAILIVLVHAVPLVLMPVAYGVAFEREVIDADDLERLRASR
jgi:hypothetical protein